MVAAGIAGFSQWRHEGDFRPLYTGLAAEDAGAVVQKLKEAGTEFRLSENGTTVLAPSARLAELRLQLAASGLPKSGRMGFELFDKTSFGVTEVQSTYRSPHKFRSSRGIIGSSLSSRWDTGTPPMSRDEICLTRA